MHKDSPFHVSAMTTRSLISLVIAALTVASTHAYVLPGARLAAMLSAPATRSPPACLMAKKKKAAGKTAMVQVVLNQPVKGIGKKGEVVSVKSAYAENVIIRGGLGELATDDKLAEIEVANQEAAAAAAAEKAAAVETDKKLVECFGEGGVLIKKKAGPDGALFGSVTPTELAEALKTKAGVTVDKKSIRPPEMKQVGSGTAEIQLHKEVTCSLKVVVEAA